MEWWSILLIGLGCAAVGGFLGFFISKKVFEKKLRDNPPISREQIKAMFMSMGRKPSEAQLNQVMNSMKKGQ